MLEIRLLGQFDVRANDIPLVIPSRLLQSLLAYLLINRATPHRREKIAGLFWPESSETDARHNLRQGLWRLRKSLDVSATSFSDLLLSDDLVVGIDPQAAYSLDVAQLEETQANLSTDDLMRALDAYQGELLPDFYDEWVTCERERLHTLFEQQVERLLEQLRIEQSWKETLRWGERWIALGHSPEPAYRALMIAHGTLGNRSQVATVFERCATALKDDLSVEPSEQTRALYEQLLKDEENPGRLFPFSSFILHPTSFNNDPPYKGLHYFDEDDANLFFGREQLVALLAGDLQDHHWLTVVGASGSGKSSLVRAGLIPAMKATNQNWGVHVFTPTAHPLESLAIQLTRGDESTTATTTLMDDLACDARALRIHIGKSIGETSRLLLVIDQCEELFTLCRDERERQSFIDNLLLATAPELDRPVYVVVVLRADLYAQCAAYANLREALSQRQEFIGPMTAEEMRRAIEGPAARGRWELEPGLVELILRDVGSEPGALPLLSHALLETWKRRRERVMTLEGYASCGGVHGAIAQTAETVYGRLDSDGQAIVRSIFLQLTELGEGTPDTRRRATQDELLDQASDASRVRQVLNSLVEARLVTLGENTVEVAHEALIREWSRLREWLNQNREGLRLHRRLSDAAQTWGKSNHDPSELYRGARLAQALEWTKTRVAELNPLEQEFLDASSAWQAREEAEREAQRQRELIAAQKLAEAERRRANILRWGVMGSTLLLVVMIGLAVFAFSQRDVATNEQRTAFARELSVNAVNNLTVDPERSMLLALQAISVSTANGKPVLREAEDALHRAVQATHVQLTLHGHTAAVFGIAYSPDGTRIATGSFDKTAKVWDATTGSELLTLRGHTDNVGGVVFSPDGKRIATAGWDQTARIWDAETGQELLTLRGHTNYVQMPVFSPDGTRLATPSYDGTVKLWDVVTGKELFTLNAHTGGVKAVAFSPDGMRLATASWSGEVEHTAKVWDATTGKLLLTLKGHTGSLTDVTFSPDGKRIATGCNDGTAKIWDSASGQLLLTLFPHSTPNGVVFSPDLQGAHLATANSDGTAKVWDSATGELLGTLVGHAASINHLVYSPDGTHLATASSDGIAKVWDITPSGSREWLTLAGHSGILTAVAYSPDGRRVAAAGVDKVAKIWDATTGEELRTLVGHSSIVRSIAFSPDGRRLASTSLDQTVRIWDATTGKQLLVLSVPTFVITSGPRVAFSPDGQRIASAAEGATAKVWAAETGQVLLTLCCHTGSYVRGVAFSPDGMRLVTGALNGVAKVWDATTGKELLTFTGNMVPIWAVSYSPDGQRIATASNDGTANVWDANTGKLLFTLSSNASVPDVVFSPDGTLVATAGVDSTVKVWNVSTASASSEQPLTFYYPIGALGRGVAFSPDGKHLAAAMQLDRTVRIYALPLQEIVAIAKSRLTRTWTLDECQKYLHVETCPPDPRLGNNSMLSNNPK